MGIKFAHALRIKADRLESEAKKLRNAGIGGEELDRLEKEEEECTKEFEQVARTLTNAFAMRYVDIFQLGQNSKNEDMSDLGKKYCVLENELFDYQQEASTKLEKWKNELTCKLEASELSLLEDEAREDDNGGEADQKKRRT